MYFEDLFIGLYSIWRPHHSLWSLLFFWRYIFLNGLYYKYIANITFKQLRNDILHFIFTILLKNGQKHKRRWHLSEENNKRKTKQCNHDDICKWNRDSFPVKLKLQGESIEYRY